MVVKRHWNGRRRFDAKAKRALVEQCLQPGVSVAGLALEHGVNANLLRKWIMRYQQERDGGSTAAQAGIAPAEGYPTASGWTWARRPPTRYRQFCKCCAGCHVPFRRGAEGLPSS
jgi:transposase